MAEYIDREELLELYCTGNTVIDEVGVVPLQVIRQNIMDMPAQDVAPVRHGHWIRKPHWCVSCSYCGKCTHDYEGEAELYNYCPNCGAKMDEGE